MMSSLKIFDQLSVSSMCPLSDCLSVSCQFEAILVKGRYLKLSREVSQTPWHMNEEDLHDEPQNTTSTNQ